MGANRDVRAEMCERGRILTRGMQGSAQSFAGASGDMASGDAFLTRYLQGCASGDVFLTQCLQGSTQCFAGANRDVLVGSVLSKLLN
jgi:hypothetical protein